MFYVPTAIVPGPREPKTDEMNYVLRPLIDELLVLIDGVTIMGLRVRVKILMWASNLPACRKCLGFLACTADKGCSKCHQHLVADGMMSTGTSRTAAEHRAVSDRLTDMRRTSTKSAREEIERRTGTRYFVFSLVAESPVINFLVGTLLKLLSAPKYLYEI